MPVRIGPRRPFRVFITQWREKRLLTQEQLANRLEVSPMTISRWERGTVQMNTAVMAALAEALDLDDPLDIFRPPEQESADALLRDQPQEVRDQAIRVIKALREAS